MKRETLSTQMHAEAVAISRQKAERAILKPGRKGVKVMGNRFMHSITTLKESAAQSREARIERREDRVVSKEEYREEKRLAKEERKQEKAEAKAQKSKAKALIPEKSIEQPTSTWRDRLSSVASKGKSRLSSIQNITDRISTAREVDIEDEQEETEETIETVVEETPVAKVVSKPVVEKKAKTPTQPVKETARKEKKIVTRRVIVPEQSAQADIIKEEDLSEPRRKSLLKRVRRKKEDLPSPLQEAKMALEAKQYQQVEDIMLPYIVQHTQDTNAYMLLGHAAFGNKSWDEAVEIFEQVEKMNTAQEGLKAAKGRTALRCGKITLALETLQRAHDDEPENKEVLEDLITIAQRMDNDALKKSAEEQLTQLKAEEEELA